MITLHVHVVTLLPPTSIPLLGWMSSARPEEGKNHLNTGFYKKILHFPQKKKRFCMPRVWHKISSKKESGIKTHPTNHALYTILLQPPMD